MSSEFLSDLFITKYYREVAAPDLGRMGMEILSFTIKDVVDSVQYLDSLGKSQTAMVKRDAEIGRNFALIWFAQADINVIPLTVPMCLFSRNGIRSGFSPR